MPKLVNKAPKEWSSVNLRMHVGLARRLKEFAKEGENKTTVTKVVETAVEEFLNKESDKVEEKGSLVCEADMDYIEGVNDEDNDKPQ